MAEKECLINMPRGECERPVRVQIANDSPKNMLAAMVGFLFGILGLLIVIAAFRRHTEYWAAACGTIWSIAVGAGLMIHVYGTEGPWIIIFACAMGFATFGTIAWCVSYHEKIAPAAGSE